MKSFGSGVKMLARYKIQLAILGILISIASFEVWKWNQEQAEKFLNQQQAKCQQELDTADSFVSNSKSLNTLRFRPNSRSHPPLDQPGITVPFKENKNYVLLYTDTHSLIPREPRYPSVFFERLAANWKDAPPPLWVLAKPLGHGQALVYTNCSPEPFPVDSKNLYDFTQKNDYNPFPFGDPWR